MSVPDLSIKIIRFIVSSYNNERNESIEKHIYEKVGNYLRLVFTHLNENTDSSELLKIINQFEDKELDVFYQVLCDNNRNRFLKNKEELKKFKKEFKARILIFVCKELDIKIEFPAKTRDS